MSDYKKLFCKSNRHVLSNDNVAISYPPAQPQGMRRCKECRKEYRRLYFKEHPEKRWNEKENSNQV